MFRFKAVVRIWTLPGQGVEFYLKFQVIKAKINVFWNFTGSTDPADPPLTTGLLLQPYHFQGSLKKLKMAKSDILHQCEMCDFSTNDSTLWLKNHKQSSVTFHCEKCQYKSCTFQGLQIHEAKTHSKNEEDEDNEIIEVIKTGEKRS